MSEYVFFFNDPATTELDTYRHPLALPDALPSCDQRFQVNLAGCDQFQRPVEDIGVTEHGLDPHLFRDRARHVELDLADRKSHEHDGAAGTDEIEKSRKRVRTTACLEDDIRAPAAGLLGDDLRKRPFGDVRSEEHTTALQSLMSI